MSLGEMLLRRTLVAANLAREEINRIATDETLPLRERLKQEDAMAFLSPLMDMVTETAIAIGLNEAAFGAILQTAVLRFQKAREPAPPGAPIQ